MEAKIKRWKYSNDGVIENINNFIEDLVYFHWLALLLYLSGNHYQENQPTQSTMRER